MMKAHAADSGHTDAVKELLHQNWPQTHFRVELGSHSSRTDVLDISGEDGPPHHQVESVIEDLLTDVRFALWSDMSRRSVALGVLLDYEAAAEGAINLYDGGHSSNFYVRHEEGAVSFPSLQLREREDPWRSHPDRALAALAETLGALVDDSAEERREFAARFIEIGGWDGLRAIHDRLSA